MSSIKYIFYLFSLSIVLSCGAPGGEIPAPVLQGAPPKNVVLMIGDGMGLTQISAAMYSNGNKIVFEKFPVIGFHKSHAYDKLITDSAAGATAFACGLKTYYNAIGVDKDTVPCKTILETAEDNGYATGIVVTSTLVHATPACFYAHQKLRTSYEEIAADLIDHDIDFLIGGGKRYFDRRESDNRDLYRELREKGYIVGNYFDHALGQMPANAKKNFAYFTADTDPVPVDGGRKYLPMATRRALNFLNKRTEKGFFLVVEGSQIDWSGHSNNAEQMIAELLDFNASIQQVINFADKNENTLVVVTADHETGGMAINPGSKFKEIVPGYTTNGHTATMIPVFAYGPGSELFSGIYENTEIYHKIRQALQLYD